jgi:hypothetical protein
LKNVYCDANAIDDVIHQFENDVSLREKAFYSDQICVFYATFFQIVQQHRHFEKWLQEIVLTRALYDCFVTRALLLLATRRRSLYTLLARHILLAHADERLSVARF